MELFRKTYGASSVIKRDLMTYDVETFEERVFSEMRIGLNSNGQREVCPMPSILKADYHFLSSYQSENQLTRKIIRRMIADRLTNFTGNVFFPKIRPWQDCEGKIRVRYIEFAETKTRLAIEITGFSYPDGPEILDSRPIAVEKPIKTSDPKPEDERPGVHANFQKEPLEVDLNQEQSPDSSINVVSVKVGAMAYLNRAEIVRPNTNREAGPGRKPGTTSVAEPESVSTDVSHGGGKDVGKATVAPEDAATGPCTVQTLWTSLYDYKLKYPKKLHAIHCYTLRSGYKNDEIPRLQSVKSVMLDADRRGWFYLKERDRPRGVLIARLSNERGCLYILSLQRRSRVIGGREKETESFSGVVFTLNADQTVEKVIDALQKSYQDDQIRRLVPDQIRDHVSLCTGFQHRESKVDEIAFRSLIDRLIKNHLSE